MLRRAGYWLMWGMFAALQALAPFLHAHASAGHGVHADPGGLHLHLAPPAGEVALATCHDAVLTAEQGLPSRVSARALPPPAVAGLPGGDGLAHLARGASFRPEAARPAIPPAPPPYTRPPSLAPPAA